MTSAWAKTTFVRVLSKAFDAIPALPACARTPLIAMAALESGWGTTAQAVTANNYWNLSAGSQEHGRSSTWPEPRPVMIGLDKEPDGKGGWRTVHQYWRVYDSPLEGVEDFLRAMTWPRYRAAGAALQAGNGELFIEYLGPDRAHQKPPIGGWYTLPTDHYLVGWRSCRAEVEAILSKEPREDRFK